jgi:hypothetical protein
MRTSYETRLNKYVFVWMLGIISLLKIFVGLSFIYNDNNKIFEGGNDADYYHSVAVGDNNLTVNGWAVLLQFLGTIQVYDRNTYSLILILLTTIIIPIIAFKTVRELVPKLKISLNKPLLYFSIIVAGSPTVFYYSLDIYRDSIMCTGFAFLLYVLAAKYKNKFFKFLIVIGLVGILFFLRWYLGIAIILSLALATLPKVRGVWFYIIFFIIVLYILSLSGILDLAYQYRERFSDERGGTSFDSLFASKFLSPLNVIQGISFIVLGLYFANLASIFLFIAETLPAIAMFKKAISIKFFLLGSYYNRFITFFIISYSVAISLAIGNLGSGARARYYLYYAIAILGIVAAEKIRKNREVKNALIKRL